MVFFVRQETQNVGHVLAGNACAASGTPVRHPGGSNSAGGLSQLDRWVESRSVWRQWRSRQERNITALRSFIENREADFHVIRDRGSVGRVVQIESDIDPAGSAWRVDGAIVAAKLPGR